jgi:hypothetical protein
MSQAMSYATDSSNARRLERWLAGRDFALASVDLRTCCSRLKGARWQAFRLRPLG